MTEPPRRRLCRGPPVDNPTPQTYPLSMKTSYGLAEFTPPPQGVALTIGNFDGVHLGHAQIVAVARRVAAPRQAPVVALTLEPHPLAILAPERAPPRLTTVAEKQVLLARAGADHCIVLHSDPALLALEADDFLASLVTRCHPLAFVEGPDFNFGRGRGGSIETLQRHAPRWGYEVHKVPAVHCEGLPTRPTVSSSSIRQALRDGRIDEARAMLGRPYRIVGTTGHGEGRGAGLGFPTANLDHVVHLLPQDAVYAGIAQLDDDSLHLAAVNIGPQPTFDQELSRVEVHVLDYAGDLRGRRLGLYFLARLRDQQKFPGPDELIAQLHRDVAATRALKSDLDSLQRGTWPLFA
jgi:riboflavin kinase / FMN adenylyltransferase